MQNLINELSLPRQVAPTSAMLRAAQELQNLAQLHKQDLAGGLAAEQHVVHLHSEIATLSATIRELTERLNSYEAISELQKENSDSYYTKHPTADKPSNTQPEVDDKSGDQMSG